MRRLLILGGLIAALGGCAGRDFTKPISVTQDWGFIYMSPSSHQVPHIPSHSFPNRSGWPRSA